MKNKSKNGKEGPAGKSGPSTATPKIADYKADLERMRQKAAELSGSGDSTGLVMADALIRGMRDIGYKNTAFALFELVDNALQAGAQKVSIELYSARGGAEVTDIAVADDGHGMPREWLRYSIRWGGTHRGRWLWVLLNSGSCGAYAFNHNPGTLKGVHSYRQPAGYFPLPGGTFAGESLPGAMTWARCYLKNEQLWMDLGRGEVVKLPPKVRDAWWQGTTRQWPFMAADLGCSMETVMAHYLSNHIAVAYGDIFGEMVAASQALGFKVRVMSK